MIDKNLIEGTEKLQNCISVFKGPFVDRHSPALNFNVFLRVALHVQGFLSLSRVPFIDAIVARASQNERSIIKNQSAIDHYILEWSLFSERICAVGDLRIE